MPEWSVFLLVLDEVRRATMVDNDRATALAFRSTITETEFHEMRTILLGAEGEDVNDGRYGELYEKIFFEGNDVGGSFNDTSDDWQIDVVSNVVMGFTSKTNMLYIEWDFDAPRASADLLLRLATVLPPATRITHTALKVSRMSEPVNERRIESVRIEEIDRWEREFLWSFALRMATLYAEADPRCFELEDDWREVLLVPRNR